MKKRGFCLLLIFMTMLGLSACSKDEEVVDVKSITPNEARTWSGQDDAKETTAAGSKNQVEASGDDIWAVYWYLCGSDLESDYGSATVNIQEMMEVELPDQVQVVIQTGGAKTWNNDVIEEDYTERYVYDSEGLRCVEQLAQQNMGDGETLEEFLAFCTENYPANHTMVLFWNHGGGSIGGVCYDECYDYDALTLEEIYRAFSATSELSMDDPPFDMVGMDACLMATIDTAYTFCDVAEYMVASQESEPSSGWNYIGWLGALSEDPSMDGARLGRIICDTYYEACEYYDVADMATLSLIDLGKIEPLLLAYEHVGAEALALACEDSSFPGSFGRGASASENYGGNTREQGFSNMVDLYGLIRNNQILLGDEARELLTALKECVLYKVSGKYRQEAMGLSCYYSYNGDVDECKKFTEISAGEAFAYFYEYALTGNLSSGAVAYLETNGYEKPEEVIADYISLEELGKEEAFPVYVDENACAVLELKPEVTDQLTGIYFQLLYVEPEADIALWLGSDNNIDMDWENGVFRDNFNGTWGCLDGCLCYMEIVYEGENYNLYSVPILLNGKECNLQVVYDYQTAKYRILGAKRGLEYSEGAADKNLVKLKPGDEVTTVLYASSMEGDDDFLAFDSDTITVTEDTMFQDEDMGDGQFMMLFELRDYRGESVYSDYVLFTVEDGEIYTEAK